MRIIDYWNFNTSYDQLPVVGEMVSCCGPRELTTKVVSMEEYQRGDYKVWRIEFDGCFLCRTERAHNEIVYFTDRPFRDKMGAISSWKKRCSYHDGPFDGSTRYDKSNANDLYPIGYEMRWISDYSNNKHILACTCGKGYFPEELNEKEDD